MRTRTIVMVYTWLLLCFVYKTNTDPATNDGTQTADDGTNTTTTPAFTKAQSDDIKAKRQAACQDIDLKVTLRSDAEMDEQREKYSNSFVETVDLLLDVYTNGDYLKLLDVKLIFMIVITIFFVLVFISLIIFFFNICLCCCDGNEKNRSGCIKCNLAVAFVGLVGFGACCGLMVYYIYGVQVGMGKINCSLHILTDDVINGNNDYEKYLGFYNISSIIKTYVVDYQTLIDNHVQNFANIKNMSLPSSAQVAYDSIGDFVLNFANRTTHDADGGDPKTPISISEGLDNIKVLAEAEFKATQDVCQIVHDAAVVGFEQTNSAETSEIKTQLVAASELIDGFSTTIYDSFGILGDQYNTVHDYYDIGQLSFIIFCFTCLAIGVSIYVCLCCALKKNKCTKFCCCRIIIAVLGFFTFIFTIFSFTMGAITFGTSASCGLIKQFSTKEGLQKFVDLFKLEGDMMGILENCILESGTGKLNSIFGGDQTQNINSSSVFTQMESILSVFDQYKTQIDSLDPDNNSLTLKEYAAQMTKVKTGEVVDHANVAEGLALINSIVSCAGEVYVFSTDLCPSSGTCKVIENVNTYEAPACQTDATKNQQASDMVIKLKVYFPETVQLMTELIDNSFETVNNTPNKRYKSVVANFRTAVDTFDDIKVDLADTLNMMQDNTLEDGANCKIMRAEFQTIEEALCFNFVPNMYKFMLVALIGSVLFFSFIWHFCCGTFCLERSGKHGDNAEFNDKMENDVFRPNYAKKDKYTYFEN
jgi:hypothetical protein